MGQLVLLRTKTPMRNVKLAAAMRLTQEQRQEHVQQTYTSNPAREPEHKDTYTVPIQCLAAAVLRRKHAKAHPAAAVQKCTVQLHPQKKNPRTEEYPGDTPSTPPPPCPPAEHAAQRSG